MIFAFDENVSTAIVQALKSLDYPVVHCTDFLARGTPDDVLFEEIASRGYFLVTQDQNMSRKKHQRAAMLSLGLGVFVFTGRASRTNKGDAPRKSDGSPANRCVPAENRCDPPTHRPGAMSDDPDPCRPMCFW